MQRNMLRRRSFLVVTATVGSALLLLNSAPAIAQTAKEPILIGIAVPTTMSFAQQNIRGIDLAVKQINAGGGVLGGRPIKTIVYDDQNKPEEGAAAFERLITRDKVKGLIGSVGTSVTAAELAVSKRYKKVHFAHSAKSEVLRNDGHPLAFFINSTVGQDSVKLDEYIAKELKPKRVVIFAEQSDYGESAITNLKRDWAAPGSPSIVGVERFDPKDTDLSPVLTKIKGMNPDGIYLAPGQTEMFANILKQMNQLGVPGLRLPAPGAVSAGLMKLAGKDADGLVFGDFWTADADNAEAKAFLKEFKAEYGATAMPDKNELIAYESVLILARGIDRAGPRGDDEAIGKAIREGSWTTPRGAKWKFEKVGASYQAPVGFVLLTIKDGEIVRFKR